MWMQHTRAAGVRQAQEVGSAAGIIVPLGLPGLQIVQQRRTVEGELEVTVIGAQTRAPCPQCGRVSAKQHDVRSRRKRDVSLGAFPVILILRKRRFRCFSCQRVFTEVDSACGWRRRTTARLREALGEAACTQTVAQVATAHQVGARLVRACVETVVERRLQAEGRSLNELRARCPRRATWALTSLRAARANATTRCSAIWRDDGPWRSARDGPWQRSPACWSASTILNRWRR